MGKGKKVIRKVVLDTNILLSALLFKGKLAGIVDLWRSARIVPALSRETFAEFKAVLGYPKFSLSSQEILMIIEQEVLPYFEIVEVGDKAEGVCRDPNDEKFIACAVSASAEFIVTVDKDLLDMGVYKSVRIVSASKLLEMFGMREH